jgi:hypothetical protein
MSEIPDEFESTVRAMREVAAEFDLEAELQTLGNGQFIWLLALSWTDVSRAVAFVLDIDAPLLAVFVELELPQAEGREVELMRAVTLANYGLLPGAFEMDLDALEVRYRDALWPLPPAVETADVAQLLAGALRISEAYVSAFRAVIVDGTDPVAAVENVEGQ